jgi:hypothetical protein
MMGGDPTMDDAKRTVDDSEMMVQQMAGAPGEVIEALDRTEREKLATELPMLAERAAGVRTTDDLLALAEAIHQLVEGIPALAEFFPTVQLGVKRGATREDLRAKSSDKQAQEQAAQIYNSVVEFDQGIKRELRELTRRSNDDHEQTRPGS